MTSLPTQTSSKSRLSVPILPPNPRPRPRLQGDGEPGCPRCLGRGSVQQTYTPEELRKLPPWEIPSTHWVPCLCTRARREREAIERVWRGLGQVEPVTGPSALGPHQHRSLWLRVSSLPLLLAHLARVVRDEPELRRITRVVSDVDLVDAETADWGDSDDQPREDDERVERSTDGRKAVDLYLPPGLLVLLLGQSSKKHKYLAALAEDAVRRRSSQGRPTWVVDEVERPLATGHRTYSNELGQLVAQLPRYLIDGDAVRQVKDWPQTTTGTRTSETAPRDPVKAGASDLDDKLTDKLAEAGLPAGLPCHPKGGAAADCDVCGGAGTKSIFLGYRGDLLEMCYAPGCATHGKAAPLGKLRVPVAKPDATASPEADEAAAGPQVVAAAAWMRQQLASSPRPWKTIEADGRDAGYSRSTLYRARKLVDTSPAGPVGERVVALTSPPPAASTTLPPAASTPHNVAIDDLIDSLP